jgi:hypothetical protein
MLTYIALPSDRTVDIFTIAAVGRSQATYCYT